MREELLSGLNARQAADAVPLVPSSFVAAPLALAGMMPNSPVQGLYAWAYAQAQQAVAARTERRPDLFAIFN